MDAGTVYRSSDSCAKALERSRVLEGVWKLHMCLVLGGGLDKG